MSTQKPTDSELSEALQFLREILPKHRQQVVEELQRKHEKLLQILSDARDELLEYRQGYIPTKKEESFAPDEEQVHKTCRARIVMQTAEDPDIRSETTVFDCTLSARHDGPHQSGPLAFEVVEEHSQDGGCASYLCFDSGHLIPCLHEDPHKHHFSQTDELFYTWQSFFLQGEENLPTPPPDVIKK